MIICRPTGDYTLEDAAHWTLNHDCVVQEKVDGVWCRLVFDGQRCKGFSRSGLPLDVPILNPGGLVCEIDGELCGGKFVAWDCTSFHKESVAKWQLRDRLSLLACLQLPAWISIVRQWFDIADALNFIRKTDGEGIVLKHLGSPYDPARCGWTRAKRQITEDFYLLSVDTAKQTAEVGELVHGIMTSRGRVFGFSQIEADMASKSIGSVVEVVAMQRTKAGKLRHGRFKRFRHDKSSISGHFVNGQHAIG